jgi:integrase
MAISVQRRPGKAGDTFQLRITHPLLQRPYFYSFDDEQKARNYGEQLRALLNSGIVPAELLVAQTNGKAQGDDPLFYEVAKSFEQTVGLAPSMGSIIKAVQDDTPGLRVSEMTLQWAEKYLHTLKVEKHFAPGTIRKRVQIISRILDWYYARLSQVGKTPPVNAMRLLPTNYSTANMVERAELAERGLQPRKDVKRDRRLKPEEEERIRAVLKGWKRPDRERAWDSHSDPFFHLFFEVVINTGMRLKEVLCQRVEDISLADRVMKVQGSKGWYGAIKPRTVPITDSLARALQPFVEDKPPGLLFPYWDGNPETMRNASTRISQRFTSLYSYAKVEDMTEHDLRHEATCRWVTMRDKRGGWLFSDVEVCRIMGWTDTRMMLRYASLRGTDLADRLRQRG